MALAFRIPASDGLPVVVIAVRLVLILVVVIVMLVVPLTLAMTLAIALGKSRASWAQQDAQYRGGNDLPCFHERLLSWMGKFRIDMNIQANNPCASCRVPTVTWPSVQASYFLRN